MQTGLTWLLVKKSNGGIFDDGYETLGSVPGSYHHHYRRSKKICLDGHNFSELQTLHT
jgi:hypothetical protein